jgi:hypothetical protein
MKKLIAAVKRLMRSDTALKRRRARRAVRSAFNNLMKEYPLLGKDGSQPPPKLKLTCPICGVPIKQWRFLAAHMLNNHWMDKREDVAQQHRPGIVCLGCNRTFESVRGLAVHLKALNAKSLLKQHCIHGAALAYFGDPDENKSKKQ